MATLLRNGIGLAAIGLLVCYFTIYAPVQQMAQGAPDVTLSMLWSIMGPFFAIGGLSLIVATLISSARGADFSKNLLQEGGLHRWIVVIGMLSGIAVGAYVGMFFLPEMQAKYGYIQG